MNHAIRTILLLGCLTLMSESSAYNCPNTIRFSCVKENNDSQHTLCTLKSTTDEIWDFAAPDKNINFLNLAISPNTSEKTSQSILPPGAYEGTYALAYYGPIRNTSDLSAYCVYAIETQMALAGLFSLALKKDDSKNWQPFQQGYVCQAGASSCQFSKK